MKNLKSDAEKIFQCAVAAVLPQETVQQALKDFTVPVDGNVILVAIGKAAWEMSSAALESLGEKITRGIVLTKYAHARGPFGNCGAIEIYEAGHPIPDENGLAASLRILEMTENLSEKDVVLFLVSGGGSALFESLLPGLTLSDIETLNTQLLANGADIVEINTLRKRFSAVKGGRFAQHCMPAKVFQITLSDVLGDRVDCIASGPAVIDLSTREEAKKIVARRNIRLSPVMQALLEQETPKVLTNTEVKVSGNVVRLCKAAQKSAEEFGYQAVVVATSIACEAREMGSLAAAIARDIIDGQTSFTAPCAIIFGAETVVNLKGDGKGGRNQETALAAALGISELKNAIILSAGSDGTDGPTDAAGGIVDGATCGRMKKQEIDPQQALDNNDSYRALRAADALFVTGPTGTNVNDLVLILCDKSPE